MRKNAGFSLIELMLVISIILGLGLLEFQKLRANISQTNSDSAGTDLGLVIGALSTYAGKHMVEYQDMNNAAARPNIFPGSCAAVDADTCKLDLAVLGRESLLDVGWTPYNAAVKSPYSAYVKRIPPAGGATTINDYDIEIFVRTDNPWLVGALPLWGDLGAAARKAGSQAGVIRDGFANGVFGAWTIPVGRYPGMLDGQLAGAVKAQAGIINQHVRVNGTLAMTKSLNMGNYRINNVNDIQLLGQGSLPRQGGAVAPMVSSLAPNWVLRAVYNVADYDSDAVDGSVPIPTCADSDSSNGVPKILVKMTSLYNEMYGGMSGGEAVLPTDSQAQIMAKTTTAYGGWNYYALEDTTNKVWRTYIRRFYDNGYVPGEALAEVYCYYP